MAELISAALLGLAGVATSWSGYQAARWNGQETAEYTQAGTTRVEATRLATSAGQYRIIDVNVFMAWLAAHAAHDSTLASFYQRHFRPEFKRAFLVWLPGYLANPSGDLATPFASREYSLALDDSIRVYEQRAHAHFTRAQHANDLGDTYVLHTVIFATVLFLAGTANVFPGIALRIMLLALALGLAIYGAVRLVSLPIA